MKNEILDIELGKSYPASEIFDKIQNNTIFYVEFGHIVVSKNEKERKHEYFTDKVIDANYIKKLKDTQIQIYTVISTAICKNFAFKLLRNKEVLNILKEIEKDHTQVCLIDEEDLLKVNYRGNIKKAIILINKIFKSNNMNFKASKHENGIKISYNKIKDKKIEELK